MFDSVVMHPNRRIGEGTKVGVGCIIGRPSTPRKGLPTIIGKNCYLRDYTIVYEDVHIGDHVQTSSFVQFREGCRIGRHSSFSTSSSIGYNCNIGKCVRVGPNVFIGELTNIGNFSFIGPGTKVLCDRMMVNERVPIKIGRYTRIGGNCSILADVGDWCIIGAGSVVTKSIPTGYVAIGNPAKIIRQTTQAERDTFTTLIMTKYQEEST